MLYALILLAQGEDQHPGGGLSPLILMGLIMLVGYFVLMRPAQRQEKERRMAVAALKKNDKVINSGGIIGIVDSIKEKEDEVVLKGGIHITKSSIVRIMNPDEASKES